MTGLEVIQGVIKNSGDVDTNLISDGYHTFGELYEHRIILYMALCREISNFSMNVWKTQVHSDGSVWDGWFLLGINSDPGTQITYHLPMSKWDQCTWANPIEKAPPFDGHTSEDVLKRISEFYS